MAWLKSTWTRNCPCYLQQGMSTNKKEKKLMVKQYMGWLHYIMQNLFLQPEKALQNIELQ